MTNAMIDVTNLSIAFGQNAKPVVDQVSFKVDEGEAYGLIGESGCGKSTILRVLSGLNSNFSGYININDTALTQSPQKSFFRQVQMVFQDPYGSLHPRKTVQTILAEPLKIHGLPDKNQRIEEVLEQVGLGNEFRYRFPNELSGGQRQRVAIARSLITRPKVLLLDEPTSALDVSVQAEILNLLKKLRENFGLTYLMVSHDLAVVAHLCGKIGMMQHGKIIEELSEQDIRSKHAQHEYTKAFLAASR